MMTNMTSGFGGGGGMTVGVTIGVTIGVGVAWISKAETVMQYNTKDQI